MEYIADLHIHSRFSRATSKASTIPGLAAWAQIKGIHVIGTGDFTHPGWFAHLTETLEEAEPGFFKLKDEIKPDFSTFPHFAINPPPLDVRFVLTSEISSIYKRGGKVRKVHNVLFAPDLDSVRRINSRLAGIGNIESDGRPILGLDSRDLLEILLEEAPEGFLVPAHIWTPWFSLFGSKSGFDTIEECFGDLSSHIFALETGLSSDPDMNRLISALDRFTLISNSDCHSPGKLGREANIFSTGFDYFSMREAIRSPQNQEGEQLFSGTIEFFPEEGKYHCDGHRKCKICCEPLQTRKLEGLCPECGRPLTIGVLYRVMELADRREPVYPPGSPKVYSIVPLPELISELVSVGPASKKVMNTYAGLINTFGSEFTLLLKTPVEEIGKKSPMLAEAIRRIRSGKVIRNPGYDGEFGKIRVFADNEREEFAGQLNLFQTPSPPRKKKKRQKPQPDLFQADNPAKRKKKNQERKKKLNPEQQQIVQSQARHIIVKAGPGTGKTFTLVARLASLLQEKSPCTVITFTNKAADELRLRIEGKKSTPDIFIGTFHGYCLRYLREVEADLQVAGPGLRTFILRQLYPELGRQGIRNCADKISEYLTSLAIFKNSHPVGLQKYFELLSSRNLIDIDAVVPHMIGLLTRNNETFKKILEQTGPLYIDEFQDLNQSQYQLVKILAGKLPVFAIGDPDQAIYGFRGSDPAFFFDFIHDLKPHCYSLVRNYRSAPHIVQAATDVIRHNDNRKDFKQPRAIRKDDGKIYYHRAGSAEQEARFIVSRIEQILGGTSHREIDKIAGRKNKGKATTGDGKFSFSDIVVLYRTGRQADVLAEIFGDHGIPHQVVDIVPYYRKGETRRLYLWLLVAAGVADVSDYLSLLGLEPGIGSTTVHFLESNLAENVFAGKQDFFHNALKSIADKPQADRQYRLISDLHQRLDSFCQKSTANGLQAALRKTISRYQLEETDDIHRLLALADSFGTSLDKLADHLRRYSDTVVYDKRAEAVALMTLHASKGLEFPVVFICGLEEGFLPIISRDDKNGGAREPDPESTNSLELNKKRETKSEKNIEEERRLFYVGMTRAIETLWLSSASTRVVFGQRRSQKESRFIQEIPSTLLQNLQQSKLEKKHKTLKNKGVRQLSLF